MQIIVTGRHVELTEELKAHVNDKANKVTRYYDRIHEIDVVVAMEAGQHVVEFIARADHHHRFVAKERHADAFAAVDLVTEQLKRQVTRYKEETRNRMHEGRGAVHGGPSAMQLGVETGNWQPTPGERGKGRK